MALERLFNLDAQLLFDTAITAINIFILFIIISYLLAEPARKFLNDRKERIRNELEAAQKDKTSALELKNKYEAQLQDVDSQKIAILNEARKNATDRQEQIIKEANEEADRIRQRAKDQIALEQKKAVDDMKTQIVDIASLMAERIVGASIDPALQDSLIQKTLDEMGENAWQS